MCWSSLKKTVLILQIPSGCTVPKPFQLATGRRIEERHRYDEELQRRQDAAEERDRELEEERERKEKQKLKEYRKTLVIKVGCVSMGHHLVCVCVCVWGGGGGGGGGGFPNCHGVHKDVVIKVSCVSIGSVVVIV